MGGREGEGGKERRGDRVGCITGEVGVVWYANLITFPLMTLRSVAR